MIMLRDLVIGTRSGLGELQPRLFNDIDIVRDLNVAVRSFCSEAQGLTNSCMFVTTPPASVGSGAGQVPSNQEYQLPEDVEQPTSVKVQIGVLFPVTIAPQRQLQQGAAVSAVPLTAYFRRTTVMTGQVLTTGSAGSTEVIYPFPNTVTGKPNIGQWVIGFYPMPASNYNVFVDYIAYHPQLTNALDPVSIPEMFFNGITGYAIAQGKKKEGDVQSYQLYMSDYQKGKQEFREYMERLQTQITPPQWGNEANPWLNSGPSVTILAPINPMING